MLRNKLVIVVMNIGMLLLGACGESAHAVVATPAAGVADCEPSGELQYVCGPQNAEDILQVGDTEWLITSGMNGDRWGTDTPGHLYLINHLTRAWEVLFPGAEPVFEQDMARFPDCPAPLNINNFSGHGLALREVAPGQYLLYVTSHGDREAIEAFRVDAGADKPVIRWIGCVVLPNTVWPNSVAILNDGGFVTTKFIDPTDAEGFNKVRSQVVTGGVWEWHPGKGYHFPQGPYDEYEGSLGGLDKEKLKSDLERLCNTYVLAGGKTEIIFMTREEMQKTCRYTPDFPMEKGEQARVIVHAGFAMPCGGTPVADLVDIGPITIRKIKQEKDKIRIGYDVNHER